jgi:hypothetical protein
MAKARQFFIKKDTELREKRAVIWMDDGTDEVSKKSFKLKNLPQSLPRGDQLQYFGKANVSRSQTMRKYLEGTALDKAYFLTQYALEFSYSYMIKINHRFRNTKYKVNSNTKLNLIRIA